MIVGLGGFITAPAYADGATSSPTVTSSPSATAQKIDSSYVVFDLANVLSESTKNWLVTENQELQNTAQKPVVAIYTASALPAGANINTYRTQVFNRLQIGNKTQNNGVLVLVFPQSRKYAVAYGSGITGSMATALSNDYIQSVSTSYFRAGNYDAGIKAALNSTINIVKGDTSASSSDAAANAARRQRAQNFREFDSPASITFEDDSNMGVWMLGAFFGLPGIILIMWGIWSGVSLMLDRKRWRNTVTSWLDGHYIGLSSSDFATHKKDLESYLLASGSTDDDSIESAVRDYYLKNQFTNDLKKDIHYRSKTDYSAWLESHPEYIVIDEPIDVAHLVSAANTYYDTYQANLSKNVDVINALKNDEKYSDVNFDVNSIAEEFAKDEHVLTKNEAKKELDKRAADMRFEKDYEKFKSEHPSIIDNGFKENAFKDELRRQSEYDSYGTFGSVTDPTWMWLYYSSMGPDLSMFYAPQPVETHSYSSSSSDDSYYSSSFDTSSSFSDTSFSGGMSDGGGFSGGW
jgi:uncharacterized membrane protein YgcG